MADTLPGAVTPDLLKSKLVVQLQAQHVEIEDLSGTSSLVRVHFTSTQPWMLSLYTVILSLWTALTGLLCLGGCGQAFQAVIVSPQFEKKTMLARHRLVNSVLKAEIAAIHAWTPKCYTPEQWEQQQGSA